MLWTDPELTRRRQTPNHVRDAGKLLHPIRHRYDRIEHPMRLHKGFENPLQRSLICDCVDDNMRDTVESGEPKGIGHCPRRLMAARASEVEEMVVVPVRAAPDVVGFIILAL